MIPTAFGSASRLNGLQAHSEAGTKWPEVVAIDAAIGDHIKLSIEARVLIVEAEGRSEEAEVTTVDSTRAVDVAKEPTDVVGNATSRARPTATLHFGQVGCQRPDTIGEQEVFFTCCGVRAAELLERT